ncbi:MAG: carboxypeptidase-like regulatory domain-containing protein [Planctomycetota bacterium]|nr:carboxypeptidase-like regulatory domain-containing protein [Planctomycetota bacterium]
MKVNTRTCWTVFVLTLVTSVTPTQELVAGDSIGHVEQLVRSSVKPAISDVELRSGGMLAGQVVDSAGQPLAGQTIVVQQSNREPVGTRSDHEGRFRLSGLDAGLCRIECGENAIACRCWSPNTAPPVAAKELLMSVGGPVERGQRPIGDLLCGPVLIGLIIAAAIVIPIAVHNSKKSAS